MQLVDSSGKPLANLYGDNTAHLGASRVAREVAGWEPTGGDADATVLPELDKLTSRSHDLHRNSGLAQNIRQTRIDSIIGEGLYWQPKPNWQVLGKSREWMHEWSEIVRPHWEDYSSSRFFDYDGLDNFHATLRLMYSSRWSSGSAIAIPMWEEDRPGTKYRTSFKVIESDRLCNPNNLEDTSKIRGGVERDKKGKVIAYHIRNFHPGTHVDDNEREKWERIPAFDKFGRRKFIHLFHRDRPGQSRGKSAIASVMALFGLRGKYQLTEAQAAEVSSRIAGVMETPLSDEQAAELFGGKSSDYSELRKTWSGKLTSGMILRLPPGTKYASHIPNRPATAYVGFMDHISREICLAGGMPEALGARRLDNVNYSSARAAFLEAWRGFYVDRSEVIYQAANAFAELWLEDAADLGVIDAPGFDQNRTAYCRGTWLGKGMLPIDQEKAEKANTLALGNGTTTLEDIYAEKGEDWREKVEQRHRELEAATENRYRMKKLEEELKEKYGVEPDPPEEKPTDKPEDKPDPDDDPEETEDE